MDQQSRRYSRRLFLSAAGATGAALAASVVVAGNGDSIFKRCMTAIGRPDLANDPGLSTNAGRWRQRDMLDEAISTWTRSLPRDEVLRVLDEADVPAGPIHDAADIITDEQYLARGMVQQLEVETGHGRRPVHFPGIVPVLGERSLPVTSVGPDLGQHTAEVLADVLGWTGPEIEVFLAGMEAA